jgi:signal transduction histidine kinase
MRAIAWPRRYAVELAWGLFAAANLAAMIVFPSWETVPFHFVWISLTLVYGFRVWNRLPTSLILGAVVLTTGVSISTDAFEGIQLWGELFEVPLMAAMFLAMVWHAQRRLAAMNEAEALVALQERFLHDVSHELRTPVTIARGHLELLGLHGQDAPELSVALDELARIERIISRLLLLAKAGEPRFLTVSQLDVETFVEDVFVRWAEVAPRRWRLGAVSPGWIDADEESLRAALDALLENAVKYTEPHETIELRARGLGGELVIEVLDGGCGIPAEALDRVFDRFARADDARTRTNGGVGLGLSIVAAVASAHGGTCVVLPRDDGGSAFALQLPGFRPSPKPIAAPATVESVPLTSV